MSDDDVTRGYRGIPDDNKLEAMSFIALSELLSSCESGSTKFHVVEREMKKRIAKDQAKINLKNIIIGACLGGFFTIIGAVLGWWLKSCPSCQQIAPAAAVQQAGNSNLAIQPPVLSSVPPVGTPSIAQPAPNPKPVTSNAQPSNQNP